MNPSPPHNSDSIRILESSTSGLAEVDFDEPFLYRWQVDALSSWLRCGRQGVIEAVTGSGKTNVAIAASRDAIRRGLFVLVVVPSRVLMEQWSERLAEAMPDLTIGRLGDSGTDRPPDCDILVTTRHSAASRKPVPPEGMDGFLIADECHGFGGKVLRRSLMKEYTERLGLTATLQRSDDAVDTLLLPFFGGICFRYGFGEAIADGVCAQPRVAFVAVPLTESERADYIATEQTLVDARRVLRGIRDMPQRPFGAFLAAVQHLAANDGGPHGKAAAEYLDAFGSRREIVANSQAKYEALGIFADPINISDGSLLFTETVRAANHAINRLDPHTTIEIITGETPRREREKILSDFREQRLRAVAAPKVLDEGVDVPDANLGIVVSASRTRRQMIQRMGRILRRKKEGSGARFVIIFASDTMEDPTAGADADGFVGEIQDIAEDAQVFAPERYGDISSFLRYSGPEKVNEPNRIGPLVPDSELLEAFQLADAAERYALAYFAPWTQPPTDPFVDLLPADGTFAALPEERRPYRELDLTNLPEVIQPKKRKKEKKLSTGESPLRMVQTADGFALQCLGCGTLSQVTPYKFKVMEQTVECDCDG
ncbi:MAG: DEAD/DEAH box helicase [Acidimicrobiales bacterium]|nr:DEAD/DEAH box helicase [Acidimicrobiales bacterium]